jgi:hypothetical protein
MSFEDFSSNTPVITATDYEKIRIKAGEGATTENFNRSVVDAINRDIKMEAALTYMARSSSLFTTSNTRFLSHCEGTGTDVVGLQTPVLTTESSDIFVSDDKFIGAAWPQRSVTNQMSYGTVDASMQSLSGWTVTTSTGLQATTVASSTTYLQVSTAEIYSDITPGEVTITSKATPLKDADKALNKVSGGVTLSTTYNMIATNTEAVFRLKLLGADAITEYASYETTLSKSNYTGVLGVENVDVPTAAKYFQVQIVVRFKKATSHASFTFKNVMVQTGGILLPYVATTRQQCTCEYKGIIYPALGNISLLNWSIYKQYSMATHSGPIGPVFISMGNLKIGGVHRSKDGTNLVFSLYINDNGSITYSNEFRIPDAYKGEYLLNCLRIRPEEEDPSKSIVEYVIVAGPDIYSTSLQIDTSKIADGDIILGTDYVGTDFFNGPVTEVRYDTEWINDIELYVISLTKKAFSFKKSNDMDSADTGAVESINTNLILNPTARLAYIGWNNYDESQFTIDHHDVYAGNCFVWVGAAARDHKAVSDAINVKPSQLYTLRAIMYSQDGTTGEAGIGVTWYSAAGAELATSKVSMSHISQPKYSTLAMVSPANSATAKVFMYVAAGLDTQRLTWSKLKLELGDATHFSDDTGAGYALYY